MSVRDLIEQQQKEDAQNEHIDALRASVEDLAKQVQGIRDTLDHPAPPKVSLSMPKSLADLPSQVGSLQKAVSDLTVQVVTMEPPPRGGSGSGASRKMTLKEKLIENGPVLAFFALILFMGACSVYGAYNIHAEREAALTRAVLTGKTPAYDGVAWYKEHYPKGVRWGEAKDANGNPIKDENGRNRAIYDIPAKITVEQWAEVQPQLLAIYNATGETEAH